MRIERSHYSKFIHNLLEGGAELGYPVRDPNIGPQNTEGVRFEDVLYIRECFIQSC